MYERSQRAVAHLRSSLRRLGRWYSVACARDDAQRIGFVVPDRLPLGMQLSGSWVQWPEASSSDTDPGQL